MRCTSSSIQDVQAKNDLYKSSYFRAAHNGDPNIMVAMHVYLHAHEESAVSGSRPCFERAIALHKPTVVRDRKYRISMS